MNLNLTHVKSKLIALLATGLAVSSLVSLPNAAFSAEAQGSPAAAQGMGEHFGSQPSPETFLSEKAKPSYILGVAQDESISDALLMFLYLVLPTGFGLALWYHDKHNQERLVRFTLQIVSLERIWQQKSQA